MECEKETAGGKREGKWNKGKVESESYFQMDVFNYATWHLLLSKFRKGLINYVWFSIVVKQTLNLMKGRKKLVVWNLW